MFKKILSNLPIALKASNNAVLDLFGPETFKNAVLDLFRPEFSSFILKSLLDANTRLSNSQKKRITKQTLVKHLKSKALISKQARIPTLLLVAIKLIRPSKRKIRITANVIESTKTK